MGRWRAERRGRARCLERSFNSDHILNNTSSRCQVCQLLGRWLRDYAGDVTDETGKEILVTDDSWTCSRTADEGWLRADFKGGDNWSPASYVTDNEYYMSNSDSWPWASMSPNRHVIWTDNGNDTTVYCRNMMTISRIESGEFSCRFFDGIRYKTSHLQKLTNRVLPKILTYQLSEALFNSSF